MTSPVEIVLGARVAVREADVERALPGEAAERLTLGFVHSNPAWHKAKAMGFWPKAGDKTFSTWRWEVDAETGKRWLTLPRGGLERLRGALRAAGADWFVTDQRHPGRPLGGEPTEWRGNPPWPHQERVVEALLAREQGIARAPTGSGKTSALLMLILRAKVPALVVVNRSKLLEQWQRRVEAELGIPLRQQGVIRGKSMRLRAVTVAMQQSLWRLGEDDWRLVESAFGMIVADEVHCYAARTFSGVIDRMPARYRVGVSDDETRPDGLHFFEYDLFGDEPAVVVSRAEVLAGGHIVDVRARIVPTAFEADWYADAREERETPDFSRLLVEMTGNEERNAQIVDLVASLVGRGQRVLVFSHRVEHCRDLGRRLSARGIISGMMLGGDEHAAEFDETAAGLRSGEVPVGIGTYQAVGTAIDLPEVDAGVCATPMHKSRQVVAQVRGRLCRKSRGKKGAALYFMWDRAVFGRQPVLNLRRFFGSADVLDGERWVESAEYLKAARRKASAEAFAPADEVR